MVAALGIVLIRVLAICIIAAYVLGASVLLFYVIRGIPERRISVQGSWPPQMVQIKPPWWYWFLVSATLYIGIISIAIFIAIAVTIVLA